MNFKTGCVVMKKELSWEFERPYVDDNYEPHSCSDSHKRYVASGRTGLNLIIQNIRSSGNKIETVYLPKYCSKSMIQPFSDEKVFIKFYEVNLNDYGIELLLNSEEDYDAIVLMDYFGYCNPLLKEIANEERKRNHLVIIDATQSILCDFDYCSIADYYIASYRKWVPSNCAIVFSKEPILIKDYRYVYSHFLYVRNLAYSLKYQFADDEQENIRVNDYLSLFDSSEILLRYDYKEYATSKKEIELMERADVEQIRSIRKKNASILTDLFNKSKVVRPVFPIINELDCPLFVPLLIPVDIDRDVVRDLLRKEGIYLPVHWRPGKLHAPNCLNSELYCSLLSCICDQRYDEDDMLRQYNAIANIFEKEC